MPPSIRHSTMLAALLVAFAPGALAQGVLDFDRQLHEFGEIDAGAKVETVFAFTNRGDLPLVIQQVRPSCGCTVPHFTSDPVPPGGQGEVTVAFDATGRSGRVRQSVVVFADVGAAEPVSMSLAIAADVVPAAVAGGGVQGGVRFDADVVDLGTIPAGREVRHRFVMQRTAAAPLTIAGYHSFPAGASVELPMLPILREDVIPIEVVLPAAMVDGPFDVSIALETDDAEEPIKALRLVGVGE